MTHEEKLAHWKQHYEAHMNGRWFSWCRTTAYPPLWRLLSRLGIPSRPPHFLEPRQAGLGAALSFGLALPLLLLPSLWAIFSFQGLFAGSFSEFLAKVSSGEMLTLFAAGGLAFGWFAYLVLTVERRRVFGPTGAAPSWEGYPQ